MSMRLVEYDRVASENSVQGKMAHFHVEGPCFDATCAQNAGKKMILYPGRADLWEEQPQPQPQPPPPPPQQQQHGLLPPDQVFRIFCNSHLGFNLAVDGDLQLALLQANTQDESQQWMKDESYGMRVKDCFGRPAFSLINKGTGKVLKHGKQRGEQVQLMDKIANVRDDDVMWTESEEFDEGFKALRCASYTKLALTVSDKRRLILNTWYEIESQLWKVFPLQ